MGAVLKFVAEGVKAFDRRFIGSHATPIIALMEWPRLELASGSEAGDIRRIRAKWMRQRRLRAGQARIHAHQAGNAVGGLRRDDGEDNGQRGRLELALDQVGKDSRAEEQQKRQRWQTELRRAILGKKEFPCRAAAQRR